MLEIVGVALDGLYNFSPRVPQRPGFEFRPAVVGDNANVS